MSLSIGLVPSCYTRGIPACEQAGIPYPGRGKPSPLPTFPRVSWAATNLWCPRAHRPLPVQHLGSWKPVLRIGTDARGDWKIIHEHWIHCYERVQPRQPLSCSLRYHQHFSLVTWIHKHLLWCTTVTSWAFMRVQI